MSPCGAAAQKKPPLAPSGGCYGVRNLRRDGELREIRNLHGLSFQNLHYINSGNPYPGYRGSLLSIQDFREEDLKVLYMLIL